MDKGYSGMILKVLDFLGGFWIVYWLFILISAISYDPQLLGYMFFSFLIYTFPAIIYLVFRKKRLRNKLGLVLAVLFIVIILSLISCCSSGNSIRRKPGFRLIVALLFTFPVNCFQE